MSQGGPNHPNPLRVSVSVSCLRVPRWVFQSWNIHNPDTFQVCHSCIYLSAAHILFSFSTSPSSLYHTPFHITPKFIIGRCKFGSHSYFSTCLLLWRLVLPRLLRVSLEKSLITSLVVGLTSDPSRFYF